MHHHHFTCTITVTFIPLPLHLHCFYSSYTFTIATTQLPLPSHHHLAFHLKKKLFIDFPEWSFLNKTITNPYDSHIRQLSSFQHPCVQTRSICITGPFSRIWALQSNLFCQRNCCNPFVRSLTPTVYTVMKPADVIVLAIAFVAGVHYLFLERDLKAPKAYPKCAIN